MRVGVNNEAMGHLYIHLINNIPDYMPTPYRPPIGNTGDISNTFEMFYLEIKLGWFWFFCIQPGVFGDTRGTQNVL